MNDECWLEMDLYWFQGAAPGERVRELFDRLSPLWGRAPRARKGLCLDVGFLPDSVLLWNERPDDAIFPCRPPTYETWTYRRLAELVGMIRAEAGARGLGDFHVGLILLGGIGAREDQPPRLKTEGWGGRTEEASEQAKYHHVGRWYHQHPEVKDARFIPPYFFGARVHVPPDEAVCRREQPSLAEYFAAKFAALARFTGMDALVIRDNFLSPEYRRGGEPTRYTDPERRRVWTQSCLDLASELKQAMPDMILIGYHSGTSPMEEWRCHGFDLEALARSGHLDLWITQTWASAWQDYWPTHSMGYTFQLAAVLVQLAMLADTPCKHLFLIETFDAWEPWDTIHQYPGKLTWQIWAYSHAAVRLPGDRLLRSAGFYSSWMNCGKDLLPADSVAFLLNALTRCAEDLKSDPVPGGPCLVYHRPGLEALLDSPAAYCRGEAMDDWVAMLMKYGLPCLSITRSEWIETVEADAFIFPAPAAVGPSLARVSLECLRRGTPIAWMGQASLLPDGLQQALGVNVTRPPRESALAGPATLEDPELAAAVGTRGVVLNQRQRSLSESPSWQPVISALGGPVFSRHRTMPSWIWETPEWGTPEDLHLTVKSVESLQTYVAVSRALGRAGWGRERLGWQNRDWTRPVVFHFWRYAAGRLGVLLGNLETGLTGHSQCYAHGSIEASRPLTAIAAEAGSEPVVLSATGTRCAVGLGPHKSCILRMEART